MAGGVAYTVRSLHVGMLDAMALASKTAVPRPRSARDWPELRLDAVVPAPSYDGDILVVARWPGRPGTVSTMVLRSDGSRERALRWLADWCRRDVAISPMPWQRDGIELRPRRASRRVCACVLAEELTVSA